MTICICSQCGEGYESDYSPVCPHDGPPGLAAEVIPHVKRRHKRRYDNMLDRTRAHGALPKHVVEQVDGYELQPRDRVGHGKRRRKRVPSRVSVIECHFGDIRHVSRRNLGRKPRKPWKE